MQASTSPIDPAANGGSGSVRQPASNAGRAAARADAGVSTQANSQTLVANDDGEGVVYEGAWDLLAAADDYRGDRHVSHTDGATASFVFSGTFIRVLGARAADGGRADVQICTEHGDSCGDAIGVGAGSKIEAAQQVLYANYQLEPGRHRIKLTVRSVADGMNAFYLDAFAYGTPIAGDHYIDNQVGSGCSDDHSGAAPETPWCDFAPVNGATFAPGSRVLLARGATWNQLLGKLYGEGTADHFIEIDAYGAGPRPKIDRDRAVMDRAVWLDNPSYWRLANLEIADAAAGIVAYYTTNDHVGLRFEDIYTHDNDVVHWRASGDWSPQPDLPGMYHGAAILITGNVPVTASSYAIANVRAERLVSRHDSDPFDISGWNPGVGNLNFLSTTLGHHAVGDVVLDDLDYRDAKGAPNFDNVEHMQIVSARIVGMCTAHQEIGTTSLFLWSDDDVTIVNSAIGKVAYTHSGDGTATDLEAYDSNIKMRGNVLFDNIGAALEFLAFRGADDYHRGHELLDNTFYQNGLTAGTLVIEDSDSGTGVDQVSYTNGTWNVAGSVHFNTGDTATASYSINFYGSQLLVHGGRNTDRGIVAFSICDAAGSQCTSEDLVDMYASKLEIDQPAWQSPVVPLDVHVVNVRATHTKNASSSGYIIDFDAARVNDPGYFSETPEESSLFFVNQTGTAAAVSGSASGNLYYEPGGLVSADSSATSWTFVDNRSVSAAGVFIAGKDDDDAYAAGSSFSYQRYDGALYSDLSYDADQQRWTTTDGFIGRFDTLPIPCASCYLARTWTAPYAGTVAVRGWIVGRESSGDGVQARITLNGSSIWPSTAGSQAIAAGDRVGVATRLDDVAVVAGDRLRFEVGAGPGGDDTGDLTSWSPAIGYTALANSALKTVEDTDRGTANNQIDCPTGAWQVQGSETIDSGARDDAYCLLHFLGTQVVVHAGQSSDRGLVGLAICDRTGADCTPEALVDLYASAAKNDRVIWTSPLLPLSQHTLKLRASHTKNSASSGFGVGFDYITVSQNAFIINDDVAGQGEREIDYARGDWSSTGGVHYDTGSDSGAYCLIRFTGSQLVITGGKNSDRGVAAYAVCDASGENCGDETSVDAYAPSLQVKQVLWTSPLLPSGQHSVRVRATHTKNAAASDYLIDIDRAQVD